MLGFSSTASIEKREKELVQREVFLRAQYERLEMEIQEFDRQKALEIQELERRISVVNQKENLANRTLRYAENLRYEAEEMRRQAKSSLANARNMEIERENLFNDCALNYERWKQEAQKEGREKAQAALRQCVATMTAAQRRSQNAQAAYRRIKRKAQKDSQ